MSRFSNKVSEENSFDLATVTYKDTKILSNFISDQGKIIPRRINKLIQRNKSE